MRCTHRIWDERDIGLIRTHYTQNCVLYGTTGTIYAREWVVADTTAILQQSGVDVQGYAERIGKASFDKGMVSLDIGENRHMTGQYPSEAEADVSRSATDLERHTLRWLHDVFNRKMLRTIPAVYAPTAQYHGPLMAALYGHASVIHQTLGLIGSIPDAAFSVHHICSTPCKKGGEKVAVRWIMEGHHIGYAILNHQGARSAA